jgi:hypothetical protein
MGLLKLPFRLDIAASLGITMNYHRRALANYEKELWN